MTLPDICMSPTSRIELRTSLEVVKMTFSNGLLPSFFHDFHDFTIKKGPFKGILESFKGILGISKGKMSTFLGKIMISNCFMTFNR